MTDVVEIYADGACKGNPGVGGWGAMLVDSGGKRELFGGEAQTTNNRMELTAVIRALEALPSRTRARVHTDSQYVQQGISSWIHSWKRKGWRTADGKPVKNQDLWRRLDEARATPRRMDMGRRATRVTPGNERRMSWRISACVLSAKA
jgi:ribonuclease HI